MNKLTTKQKLFIEAYSGNATEAARIAGYTGNDNVLGKTGYDLLRNPKIREKIEARQEEQVKEVIASRTERQSFWTKIMNDPLTHMRDRLRASELLAKSEADFKGKVEEEENESLADLIKAGRERVERIQAEENKSKFS